MAWVGKITLKCPSGNVVRRVIGSPDAIIRATTSFDARKVGPGCSVVRAEIVKRGVGAGLPDRASTLEGFWPFGKKKRKRRRKKKGLLARMFSGPRRKSRRKRRR